VSCVDEAAARTVWLGNALHTTPGVPEFLDPEIALVTAGVKTDVLGIGRDDLTAAMLAAVTAAHPRPAFALPVRARTALNEQRHLRACHVARGVAQHRRQPTTRWIRAPAISEH
jgi:hypothetical protein